MKNLKNYFFITFVAFSLLSIQSCGNDDDGNGSSQPEPTGNSKIYSLNSVSNPDISGTATFVEFSDGSTVVDIELQNTPEGGMHPAHIHLNTAAEGGGIAISLKPIDGATGKSSTIITTLDDDTAISFDDLLNFDGYINVHASADDLATLVAQGDIGQNELTGTSKVYDLGSVAIDDISGTATFFERVNGEALAVIELQNTPEDGMHPGHIHMNSVDEGGGIAFTFNPVIGATGISKTQVAQLDDETSFGYEDVLTYDGYINIHLSMEDLATLVAQGNIGSNEN